MRGAKFSSQTLKIGNPFVPYGATMLIVGAGAIGLSLISLFEIQQELKTLFATTVDENSGPYVAAMLAVGVASGYWALWGLKNIFVGIRNLGRLVVPPGTPPDITDVEQVSRTFTERTLFSLEMPTKGPIALAYKYVSDKVPFLTPHLRVIVENSISYARRVIIFVVFLTAAFFLIDTVPSDLIPSTSLFAQPFPFIFVAILAGVAAVKIVSLFGLMPGSAPTCDTVENLHSVRGGGDPVTMPQSVEKALMSVGDSDSPNRIRKVGFQTNSGGVDDTGNFTGELFIETQPEPVSHDRASSVYILLLCGVVLTMFSVFLFTRVPASSVSDLTVIAWPFFQAIVFARVGGRLLKHSHMIMGSFRYSSIMLYVNAEGTFGRSEIRAGKGITDSFETSNVVVRCDANVKIYSARSITENYQLTGQRIITAMSADSRASEIAELVVDSLRGFQSEGVVVRGIDVASQSMGDIAKANLAYEDAKRAISVAETPAQIESKTPNLLGDSAIDLTSGEDGSTETNGSESKTCPDCAEKVKTEARKCRFCGYRFDEVISD